MTCTYCGTELPSGALFCGECGRAVAPATKRVARVQVPTVRPASRPAPEAEHEKVAEVDSNWHWGDSAATHCEHCGASMAPDDIFCGECGAVSAAAAQSFSQPRDTVVIDPQLPLVEEPPAESSVEAAVEAPVEPQVEPVVAAPVEPVVELSVAPPIEPVVAPPVEPLPPVVRDQAPFADIEDVEATRIVPRARVGERFVLQFSTGESFTVHGGGLIGRNPVPEPGEYVDEVVRVIDPSRSVSKTHLEFGQEAGAFWILDRYSGNGTVIRAPEAQAVRCQPERRYRVARGTRVDIGEQFFIVS